MDKSSLGDRMKSYENVSRYKLQPRTPVIIRIDGRAFSSYTRGFRKPWDHHIQDSISSAAIALIQNISGADIAYIQSDEISVLINTYKHFSTQPWFNNNIQKISSVSASIATAYFNATMGSGVTSALAMFDARCFTIPREEAVNYFLWRQQDAIRNSVSSLAQANFSAKQLHGKSQIDMKEMLKSININWDTDISIKNQRGWCIIRNKQDQPINDNWYYHDKNGMISSLDSSLCLSDNNNVIITDYNIPIFSEDRDFISKFLFQEI